MIMKLISGILVFVAFQLNTMGGNTMNSVTMIEIEANGMIFTCRVAGDKATGKPVMLLHGWPETSHMWIHLMKKLSAEGYYCVAPNQRGFSDGARPKKADNYELEFLVQDMIAIADAQGFETFHLIGHDWGSAVGWGAIALYPKRIKSWSALSVPHIKAFSNAIRFDKQQIKMSWYMGFFQWRVIPEWALHRRKCKRLRDAWNQSSPTQIEDYLTVFGNKKALKTTLHWYRANYQVLKKGVGTIDFGEVHHPTLLIWGNKDAAIGSKCMELTKPYMKGPFKFVELEAGHWLIQEKYEEVSKEILEHLERNPL